MFFSIRAKYNSGEWNIDHSYYFLFMRKELKIICNSIFLYKFTVKSGKALFRYL